MKHRPTPSIAVLILTLLALLPGLAGCGSVQIEVERTPTPDLRATTALGDLRAQNSQLATTVAGIGTPAAPRLSAESDSETIRRMLLYGYQNWDRLWVDVQRIDFPATSAPVSGRIQVWIDQSNLRLRALWGSDPALVDGVIVSDGTKLLMLNSRGSEMQVIDLPASVYENYAPPEGVSDSVSPHPLASVIGTAAADLVLPSGLAQRGGSFEPVELNTAAGRDALVVDWFNAEGMMAGRYWVDVETGVILRAQDYPKEGGERMISDTFITAMAYNPDFPPELFDLNSASPQQFAAQASGEPQPAAATATPQPGQQPSGTLYFMIQDLEPASTSLVAMDAACLYSGSACPEPAPVSGQPVIATQPQALVWSPGGEQAVWPASNPGRLYLYNPSDKQWQVLFEAENVYTAAWSPDGRRVGFTARVEGTGDAFIIDLNDNQVKNLTEGKLNAPDTNLAYLAWSSPERVLVAASSPAGIEVLSIDINDGSASEVQDLPMKGGLPPLPSPNGRYWATTSAGNAGSAVLIGAPGGQSEVVANFAVSSVWPMAWSPDSEWLAFSVYASQAGRDSADLYVVHPDGSGLQLIFRAARISAFAWAPDSHHLIVQADEGQGMDYLYSAGLSGLGSSRLQAPGLRLDTFWLAPSWRE